MQRILLYFILFPVLSLSLISENGSGPFLGVFTGFKEGISGVSTPSGRKNGFAFTGVPDFGIKGEHIIIPAVPLIIGADLGYSNYSFYIKESKASDTEIKEYKHKFSYISLAPYLRFDIISLGFAFGVPIAAEYGPDLDVSKLNIMAEIRAGATFKLYEDNSGKLNIYFEAGYMLTGIFSDYGKDDPLLTIIPPKAPQIISNEFNPRAVSLTLGISYLLNLGE
jgi:hypothetical protein